MDHAYDNEKDSVRRDAEQTPEFVEPTPAPDSTGNVFEGDKKDYDEAVEEEQSGTVIRDESDPAVDQTDDFRNPR